MKASRHPNGATEHAPAAPPAHHGSLEEPARDAPGTPSNPSRGEDRSTDAIRCPAFGRAAPEQHQGGERPRLRVRGRDPAPGRGPAVVAARRPDPAALDSARQGRFAVLRTGPGPPLTRPPAPRAVDTRRWGDGRPPGRDPSDSAVISPRWISAELSPRASQELTRRLAARLTDPGQRYSDQESQQVKRIHGTPARAHLAIRLLCPAERFQPAGVATVLVVVRAVGFAAVTLAHPGLAPRAPWGASEAARWVSPSGVRRLVGCPWSGRAPR